MVVRSLMRIRPATCHLVTTRVHAISILSESSLSVPAIRLLLHSTTTQLLVLHVSTNSPLKVVARSAKKDGTSRPHASSANLDAMNLITVKAVWTDITYLHNVRRALVVMISLQDVRNALMEWLMMEKSVSTVMKLDQTLL